MDQSWHTRKKGHVKFAGKVHLKKCLESLDLNHHISLMRNLRTLMLALCFCIPGTSCWWLLTIIVGENIYWVQNWICKSFLFLVLVQVLIKKVMIIGHNRIIAFKELNLDLIWRISVWLLAMDTCTHTQTKRTRTHTHTCTRTHTHTHHPPVSTHRKSLKTCHPQSYTQHIGMHWHIPTHTHNTRLPRLTYTLWVHCIDIRARKSAKERR